MSISLPQELLISQKYLGIPYPNFSGRAETRTLLSIAADTVIPPAG